MVYLMAELKGVPTDEMWVDQMVVMTVFWTAAPKDVKRVVMKAYRKVATLVVL